LRPGDVAVWGGRGVGTLTCPMEALSGLTGADGVALAETVPAALGGIGVAGGSNGACAVARPGVMVWPFICAVFCWVVGSREFR
jgi:hypothetical protein